MGLQRLLHATAPTSVALCVCVQWQIWPLSKWAHANIKKNPNSLEVVLLKLNNNNMTTELIIMAWLLSATECMCNKIDY